ncbi:hypothetical protein [Paraclostridium sordellii]|uniref:hypothetical protein n=1 Tax=Paraclostridium sordellii TaxID=1505 RepID=UPI00038602EB|nr:hypothetical protein [Paeniclostridium sordellii]EPZ56899.1 hypothetical protein H476_2380 [[Clostridium] sordellii VPI 9048] [Paeniclostridium sordellii VPI 9048]CEK38617.1 hypothetical protein JGS6382_19491 [[Clostridium] sordellii] [Paeniclostridium sordellii]
MTIDIKLTFSKKSNVSEKDKNAIRELVNSENLSFLLFCNEIKFDNDLEDKDTRIINIESKRFGLGEPDIEIVIGNYIK